MNYDNIFNDFQNELNEENKIENVETKCEHDFIIDENIKYCCKCFKNEPIFVIGFVSFYDRNVPTSAPYLKSNHFRNKINEINGVNSVNIEDDIMKLCINCTNQEDIKKKLQEHKKIKHYPLIYTIMRQKNIFVPTFTNENIVKLNRLFLKVCDIFEKIKMENQHNLINYHFVLSRLCIIINREDIIPYLFILRSKKKRVMYNQLWIKIEKEL